MPMFLKKTQYQPFIHDVFGDAKIKAKPIKMGLLNQNILLEATGKSFVLKIYRPEVDAKKLAATHRLLNFVCQHDIPVATSFASQQVEGYQVALYPLLPGSHPRKRYNSRKNLFTMGEMLGRIHFVLQKFKYKGPKPSVGLMSKQSVRAGFQQMEDLLLLSTKEDREFLLPFFKFQKTLFAQQEDFKINHFKKLPLHFCHGDYHAANILLDHGKITGVLDWEKSGWMWRSHELMRSLLFNTRKDAGEYSLEGMKAFIDGYKQHIVLIPLEKELMFEVGFRKYAFDFWAMRQFLSGQRSLRSNIKRRFLGSKTLAREREVYKNKIAEFLG